MTALTMDNSAYFGVWRGTSVPSAYYARPWDIALVELYSPRSASISSSVTAVSEFLLSVGTNIEDSVAMEDFLTKNSGIIAYLYEVPKKVHEHFGTSTLKLGLFSDPDSNDEQAELYLEIETALSPEEANEKLSKINREWLLSSGDQDLMSLNITLRFV